jgi:hypothetical protein
MKQGRTLQSLAAEIERRKETKKDYILPAKALQMTSGHPDREKAEVGFWIGDSRYGVNNIAHEQIAAYLKIPMAYYWRMLAEAPELLARNVNEWLAATDAKKDLRMARTMDGKLRALLSNGYRRFENEDFAEAVLPVIADLGLDIMSCEITDRRLYIKAVDPKVTREIKALGGAWGDGKHIIKRGCAAPAVTLSNSETGDGRLSVLGGIYQDWCTNLASFGARSLKKTHLGARHELIEGEGLYELLTDETKKKTDEALWLQVRDTVKATFDAVKFNELIDKVEGAQAEPIDGDPVKVVAAASKKFGASEGQQKSVLKHLIEGGSLSRFGLYNAFTRMAQDVEDYDEATRFEQVGGRIIELPHTEWRALAKAA